MIKKCPACNRTYSDESISFCLADGALLSPPQEDTGAATAVMPTPPAPTEPAAPSPPMPTIASPPSKPARETHTDAITPASSGAKRLLLATAGLLILAVSLVTAYWLLTRQRAPQETTAAVTNTNSVDGERAMPSDTPREAASPRAAPSMAVMPTPRDREKATPSASPQLPPKLVVATPTPALPDVPREQPVDYNKIFSGREVTQKARIFSQPRPGYTDAARQNGVSGVVTLRMVLASSGEVTNITVVSGLADGLSEKAIAAARQIKFEPAMKDGRAVSQYVQVSYTFSLY
jgi:TonB family protein